MEYLLENPQIPTADIVNGKNGGVHFTVDDLLDFSNNGTAMTDAFFDSLGGNSGDSSPVTVVESCNSSVSGGGEGGQFNGSRNFNESCHFSGNELCVPYDDLAELEWLSNFVEDSFSSGDLHFFPTTTTGATKITDASSSSITTTHSPPPPTPPLLPSEVSVPGKARSKRSRVVPCDWSSRLLMVSPQSKPTASKKRDPMETPTGRKCLHCASEKTPQWRTGPMGPKTLCNACGVRYKSGRLVPEYRPASSPTFVPTRHSNSHRKVLELRRQRELEGQHHHTYQQHLIEHGSVFNGCDEFLICQHGGINGPGVF